MAGLRIEVLGTAVVTWDETPVVLPRKPYELLCLLVIERVRPVDEAWLVHHLWRGRPPTTASTALRVYLSRLRQALEPTRVGGPSSRIARTVAGWRLRVDSSELDVLAFEGAVAEGVAALRSGDAEQAWALGRRALQTWQGEPFPAVDLEPVAAETRRLEVLLRRATVLTHEAALQAGRGADVVEELQRAHVDEPHDEDVVVRLTRALYQVRGQQAALDVLRAHRRAVRAAGLAPSPGLDVLEGQVLRHELPGPAPAEPVAAALRAAAEPAELVGREDLLATVRARCRTQQAVLLTGDAGVGKSSLLRHLQLPGYEVVRISCSVHDPPLTAVRALLASSRTPPRDREGWQQLRRLLHEGSTGPTATSVVLLAEDLLADLLRERPLLICLDDVDELDAVSAAVLTAGIRSAPETRLVTAARVAGAGSSAGPLAPSAGRSLVRAPEAVVTVPPLDPVAATRLLARLRTSGEHDRLDDASALQVARGNPWLLELMTASRAGDSSGGRLLGVLSPEAREAALGMALLDAPLEIGDASGQFGRPAVEELLVTTIAVLEGTGCRLRHELVRQVVLQDGSAEHRRAVAARVFRHADQRGRPVLDLAPLVTEAGPLLTVAERRRWAVRAGWQALRSGDATRAADCFDLTGDPGDASAEAGSWRLGRGRCLDQLGDLEGARRWYVRAITSFQAVGADAPVRDALLSYVGMFAPESVEAPLVDAVTTWLLDRRRLPLTDLLGVLDARAAAAAEAGADVHTATRSLLAAAEQVPTPLGALYRVQGRWRLGHHAGLGSIAQLPVTAACVGLAEQVGDEALLVRALRNHADSLLGAGQPAAGEESLLRLDEVARRARMPQARWWVDVMRASAAIRCDELDEGVALAHHAFGRWSQLPVGARSEILQLQLLVVAYQSGQLAAVADQLCELAARSPDPLRSLAPAAALAVDAQLGRDSGPARLEAMVEAVRTAGPGWLLPTTSYLLGRAAALTGVAHPWLEATLASHAGAWSLLGTGAATLGPVDAVRAQLVRLRGDDAAADRLETSALGLCARLEAPAWAADTRALRYRAAHEATPPPRPEEST